MRHGPMSISHFRSSSHELTCSMNVDRTRLLAPFFLIFFVAAFCSIGNAEDESYPVHPDSIVSEGVPQGEVKGPYELNSRVYRGTTRQYWVYIPKQYDPAKPACLFVVQDGLSRAQGWKLPTVMDNLIAAGDMPVTIGVFVDHGQVISDRKNTQPRFNRSFEYDSVGDQYARFLIRDLMPEVDAQYNISSDPNDRAIGGSSSGAVCAFNVAWERPDQFRRVFSSVGTFVGLRGGDELATLVRKAEPKPLRVFLQDGSNDLDIYGGDWWTANQRMLSALTYSGYEVEHVWGKGGHNSLHATAIMPDALRWLWKNHGQTIQRGEIKDPRIQILKAGSGWQKIDLGFHGVSGLAPSESGGVLTLDIPNQRMIEVDPQGSVHEVLASAHSQKITRMPPKCQIHRLPQGTIFKIASEPWKTVGSEPSLELCTRWLGDIEAVAVGHKGLFVQSPGRNVLFMSYASLEAAESAERANETKLTTPARVSRQYRQLCIHPDGSRLHGCGEPSRFIRAIDVAADNRVTSIQDYGYVHLPPKRMYSDERYMTVDTLGNLYVTTDMGVQILDPLGRVNLILEKPNRAMLSQICFSGPNSQTLYVVCGGSLFKRPLKTRGFHSWSAPIQLPRPGL